MRWIVARSLHFRWIVLFLAGTFMAFSIAKIPESKVDVFPEFAPSQVEIQTIALGNSTSEVEALVTVPIEEALNGLPGLEEMRSKSVAQLSSIRLIFKKGTDETLARQLVQERISQVAPNIPTWASPPWMMPALSATSRILKIGITSDQLDLIELSSISYWKIRQHLLRVPGVAGVDIYGERLKQRHVQVNPDLLAKYDIPIETVMEAGSEALDAGVLQYAESFTVGQGGFVETATRRLNVENVQPITSAKDLAKVPVAKRGDRVLRMSDLGDVKQDSMQLWGEAVINDGDGLMLIVQKYRGANTKEVTDGVEQTMREMAPGLPAIEYDTTIFRPATFIEESINNLTIALLLGVLLVVVIISAFLYTFRTAFISLISIPLSLLGAFLVLDARNVTINVMVLAGLVVAIGVVVDDAIIDVENIVRRLRQARAENAAKSTVRIVLEASVEIRSAITFATIINVVAIVPVLFLEGLSGSFFQPLVLSYGLAVFVSMLVAMTVTPALCLVLLHRGTLREKEAPLLRVLKRGYASVLRRVVRRPAPAMIVAAVIIAVGVPSYMSTGTQLLPNFKERDFLMHWLTEPSTSITEEKKVSVDACRDLMEIPGVRNCGSHIGQALLSDEVYGAYFGENWVSVSKDVDYDQTLQKVTNTVDSYPGMQRDVQTYLRERVKEVLTGSSGAVVVRIFGPDPTKLTELANTTLKAIGDTPGLIEAAADLQKEIPQIEIELDLEKARKHDLKPGDIRRQSSVYIASEEVSDIFSGGRAYDVHIWSIPQVRHSFQDIKDLPIDTPAGEKVKLSEVADVRFAPSPNAILRDDQSRRIDVEGNIAEGGDLGAVVEEVERRVAALELPPEYSVKVLGESSELTNSQNTLAVYGLAALLVIFLLLHAAFGSVRLAALAFLLLPVSLVGGVLAVALSDGLMSLGSLIGFLTVFGIAARNGILMITHFQHLEHEEGMEFGPELVMRGASERLAPILMTALATGLAIVPLAVAGSIPGHEIEHPMALVILGGLITATLLNLFIIPSLYLKFAKPRSRGGRRLDAPATV
ncbi:efflux RND transporter permease subunit [Aeromicrobium sp.]|uniref:efflux RND transporter permease subunit n=1 Tax=Aeromicrobium sp. TaxID=1871063 RepID=UPI003D69FFDD